MIESQRLPGSPQPAGDMLPGLAYWQWALDGEFDLDPDASKQWLPRGPAPSQWMRYHGRYVYEQQTILDYRIGDRHVLVMPEAQQVGRAPGLVHTL
ncbi:MAG: DUF6797 domain-containing protein, partial [Opitutales bacterium]